MPTNAPRARRWLWAALVAVLLLAIVGLSAIAVHPTRPACRTVDVAVKFIADNHKVLDPWLITPSGPPLVTYQDWSDQLQLYASEVADPDVLPYLRQIGELSKHAVTQVSQARSAPVSRSTDLLAQQVSGYQKTVRAIVDEENAAIAACRR